MTFKRVSNSLELSFNARPALAFPGDTRLPNERGLGALCAGFETTGGESVDFPFNCGGVYVAYGFSVSTGAGDPALPDHESFRDAGVFFLVAGVDLPSGGADVPDVDTGSVHRAGGFFD